MTTSPSIATNRRAGRLLVLLGIATAALGVLAYLAQVMLAHGLSTPWYLPALGTLAVVLVLAALCQRVTVWRIVVLVPLLLFAAAEWFMVAGSLPSYTGPVEVGKPFPVFTTTLADGTQLTQASLQGKQDTLLVFFRGRW